MLNGFGTRERIDTLCNDLSSSHNTRVAHIDANHRVARGGERVHRLVLRRIRALFQPRVREDAIGSVNVGRTQRLAIDGDNSFAVFSIGGYASAPGGGNLGNPGTLYFHSQNWMTPEAAASTATVTE